MREYTIDNFDMETVLFEDNGNWRNKPPYEYFIGVHKEGEFIINYSDILTFLIQKAGMICKRYASDLFITWEGLTDRLHDSTYTGEKLLFGFRENGMDSNAFVLSRLNCYGEKQMMSDIKELYLLEVRVDDDKGKSKYITMKLGKAILKERTQNGK